MWALFLETEAVLCIFGNIMTGSFDVKRLITYTRVVVNALPHSGENKIYLVYLGGEISISLITLQAMLDE